jgi:hypothetical protein
MLKVVPIYESNYRDVPEMMDKLKADCIADKVPAVATVCFRNGEIDVRSFGEWSLAEAAAALHLAHARCMELLKEHMEGRQC